MIPTAVSILAMVESNDEGRSRYTTVTVVSSLFRSGAVIPTAVSILAIMELTTTKVAQGTKCMIASSSIGHLCLVLLDVVLVPRHAAVEAVLIRRLALPARLTAFINERAS